ncbi:MAG: DUF3870 domain-containing protein [Dehalococcoidia bacterium]|nr:DUF3870 domain-containing protein [Dehalococcoidia bacterium]
MPETGSEERASFLEHEGLTLIFFGYARLPQALSPVGSAGVVAVEIEIGEDDHRVLGVIVNGLPTRAGRVLRDLLRNRRLDDELPRVIEQLPHRYIGLPQKALCTALPNVYDAYKRHVIRPPHGNGEHNGNCTG